MNLNRMFIFIFVFFAIFTILMVYIPSEFTSFGAAIDVKDSEVITYFSEQNITMYNYSASITLTLDSSNQSSFGLLEPERIEFWWGSFMGGGTLFQIRHLTTPFIGGTWWSYHYLVMPEHFRAETSLGSETSIDRNGIQELYNYDSNAAYVEYGCEHVSFKVFIASSNASLTLLESWDSGEILILTSYDIDWTKTGQSMWHVMTQLLTWQTPNFGIGGAFGAILTRGLSATLTGCIAILFYALITSVIPFISGWRGD